MKQIETGLNHTANALGLAGDGLEKAASFAAGVRTIAQNAYDFSEANCSNIDLKQSVEDLIPGGVVSSATDVVSVCLTQVPEVNLNSIKNLLPNIDTDVLEKIAAEIEAVGAWMQKMVDSMLNSADYFTCCDKLGQALSTLGEVFSDLLRLLSCPASGLVSGVTSEAFDILLPLLNPLVSNLNAPIDAINEVIGELNNAFTVEILPTVTPDIDAENLLWFDEGQCKLMSSFSGAISFTFSAINGPTILSIDKISLYENSDGDFDFSGIAGEIGQECAAAAKALTRDYSVNCCPAARMKRGIPAEGWASGESCELNPDCKDYACLAVKNKCTDGKVGSPCTVFLDCKSTICSNGKCQPKRTNGQTCGPGLPCESGLQCLAGKQKCTDGKVGSHCTIPWDCNSGACNSNGKCRSKAQNGENCRSICTL